MRKIKLFSFVSLAIVAACLFSTRLLFAQIERLSLETIVKQIPEIWWEGGWDQISRLESFLKENHDVASYARAQYWVGCNHYAYRDYDLAIGELEKVSLNYPKAWKICAEADFEIGQINMYGLDNYEAALKAYRKVVKNYPKSPLAATAQRMTGYSLAKLNQPDKAAEEYSRVWTNYRENKFECARAYFENGQLNFTQGMENLSDPAIKKSFLEKALSFYKKAFLYCPIDETEVMNWIVEAIMETFRNLDGDSKRAEAFIRYQRYNHSGDKSSLSSGQNEMIDPLEKF